MNFSSMWINWLVTQHSSYILKFKVIRGQLLGSIQKYLFYFYNTQDIFCIFRGIRFQFATLNAIENSVVIIDCNCQHTIWELKSNVEKRWWILKTVCAHASPQNRWLKPSWFSRSYKGTRKLVSKKKQTSTDLALCLQSVAQGDWVGLWVAAGLVWQEWRTGI